MWCVGFVLVYSGCDVVLMSILWATYFVGVGSSVAIFPMYAGLMASFWSTATVGNVPTIFVSWDIRFGRVLCLLM